MNTLAKILIPILLVVGLTSWIYSEGDDGYFTYLRGKKQYVVVQGTGEPTVVFLTGKGRDCGDFKKVYDKLKKTNQIFAYDRAGLGQSEADAIRPNLARRDRWRVERPRLCGAQCPRRVC